MPAYVLTYHSHHVVGEHYEHNDHTALALDLEIVSRAGARIVPLSELVDRVCVGTAIREKLVAVTFDDGPLYDFQDFVHPQFGLQVGFARILERFHSTSLGRAQPDLSATSFVIASPEARLVMERTADSQYTWLGPRSMEEGWWNSAIDQGLISVANHSWDHLHPALSQVAHSRQVRADFTAVDNKSDADAQIRDAMSYIAMQTYYRASPYFAYPFGHFNDFLTEEYFPANGKIIGVSAAFTTTPNPIIGGESVWSLPRYICGHHWKSPDDLSSIVGGHN